MAQSRRTVPQIKPAIPYALIAKQAQQQDRHHATNIAPLVTPNNTGIEEEKETSHNETPDAESVEAIDTDVSVAEHTSTGPQGETNNKASNHLHEISVPSSQNDATSQSRDSTVQQGSSPPVRFLPSREPSNLSSPITQSSSEDKFARSVLGSHRADIRSNGLVFGGSNEPGDYALSSGQVSGSTTQTRMSTNLGMNTDATLGKSLGNTSGISDTRGPMYPPYFPMETDSSGFRRIPPVHYVPQYPYHYQQQPRAFQSPNARTLQFSPRRLDEGYAAQGFAPNRGVHVQGYQSYRMHDEVNERLRPVQPNGSELSNGGRPVSFAAPSENVNSNTLRQDYNIIEPELLPKYASNAFEEVSSGPVDTSALTQHVHSQFGRRDYSDTILYISHNSQNFRPRTLSAHSILLARSPKLRSLISTQHSFAEQAQGFPRVIDLVVSDRFLNSDAALMKALEYLYGGALPQPPDVSPKTDSQRNDTDVEMMLQNQVRFALAFIAAGHLLEIDEIIVHGLEAASRLLSLSTLEKCFSFALDGHGSLDLKFFEAMDGTEGPLKEHELAATTLTYGKHSERMLEDCVRYLVQNLHRDFRFCSSCPQSGEFSRLPIAGESKQSRKKSRLSQIRFGEMVVEKPNAEDRMNEIFSTVLISLPFTVLQRVLENTTLQERLGTPKLLEISESVIEERETRRKRAKLLQGSQSVNAPLTEVSLWRTILWAEKVVQNGVGAETAIKLQRQKESMKDMESLSSKKESQTIQIF